MDDFLKKEYKLNNDIFTFKIEDSSTNKVTNFYKVKSSLKFCLIATGEYDLYVTEPRAREWDIAAGHAIINSARGKITDFDGKDIFYGKKGFKNPSLIARRLGDL